MDDCCINARDCIQGDGMHRNFSCRPQPWGVLRLSLSIGQSFENRHGLMAAAQSGGAAKGRCAM